MPVDLVLHNAKIYTRGKTVKAGLAIDQGRIVRVAKEPNLPTASTKMDLKGRLMLPGLVDVHVHLRDQQQAYKEDFFTGTSAAAAGGVTFVIDMPNNQPVTMSSNHLKKRMKLAEKRVIVNVAFYSAFPKHLSELHSIIEEGAVAFKLFLSKKIGGLNIDDDEALLQAFETVKKIGVPVAVHAEDKETMEETEKKMQKAERKGLAAYLTVHSPRAEAKAVSRVIRLVEKSNVQLHFCHISSEAGLNQISKAKKMGLPVTCEVTPHNLLLSSQHLNHYGTIALTDPPVRNAKNVEALWNGVNKTFVDIVASDHAPHLVEEKKRESVWDVKAGVAGLETMLPLLLTQVNKRRLTISDVVGLTSEKPTEIFHLEKRGRLEEGYHADVVAVDLKQEAKIDASSFYSKAKFSPFNGWKVKGVPVKTFVNGRLVMDEGEVVAKAGTGRIVRVH
ncbi:MAG: dihydroorotase family protein [Thermoproteota archaeon]|nr:dihydroorotase family protein [Thermoproteota archaeon]